MNKEVDTDGVINFINDARSKAIPETNIIRLINVITGGTKVPLYSLMI